MKQINLIYYSVFFLWYLLSLLPLRFLYFISDLLFYPLYYCIRYRRKIIRNNLSNSFPEKDLKEIVQIEKKFYSFFCDYIVETLKLFSISKKQLMRRMTFEGLDEIVESMNKKNKDFCFIYLGPVSYTHLHFPDSRIQLVVDIRQARLDCHCLIRTRCQRSHASG